MTFNLRVLTLTVVGPDCSDENNKFITGDAIADAGVPAGLRARIDFSRGNRADLDETALDESIGVCSNELDRAAPSMQGWWPQTSIMMD